MRKSLLSLASSYRTLAAPANAFKEAHEWRAMALELDENVKRLARAWEERVSAVNRYGDMASRGPSIQNKIVQAAILSEEGVPAIEVAFRYSRTERSVERIRRANGRRGSDGRKT